MKSHRCKTKVSAVDPHVTHVFVCVCVLSTVLESCTLNLIVTSRIYKQTRMRINIFIGIEIECRIKNQETTTS